jgi:hypothetical protein
MMGSGLAVLGHPAMVTHLMDRAAQGECRVEIYMANPFSPLSRHVWLRRSWAKSSRQTGNRACWHGRELFWTAGNVQGNQTQSPFDCAPTTLPLP